MTWVRIASCQLHQTDPPSALKFRNVISHSYTTIISTSVSLLRKFIILGSWSNRVGQDSSRFSAQVGIPTVCLPAWFNSNSRNALLTYELLQCKLKDAEITADVFILTTTMIFKVVPSSLTKIAWQNTPRFTPIARCNTIKHRHYIRAIITATAL